MNKICPDIATAIADIRDGCTVLVSGFGGAGHPTDLIHALIDQGARDLTIVNNNAGNGENGLAALLKAGRVRKIICSFPKTANSHVFDSLYAAKEIELELVPQGTLAERLRCAGAGLGGFFTPTGVGTPIAQGKRTEVINGREFLFETPLPAEFALIQADAADRWGTLTYRKTARNFGPVMCAAATTTIVQVARIVPLGSIDPEHVVTPGIFVSRVVEVSHPLYSS